MESGRTFAGIASSMEKSDGQALQHFMSNSPWSGQGVFEQIRGREIVAEEGVENRWYRHRQNAELFWESLEEIGLKCHVPENHRLPSITTVRVPDGVNEAAIRHQLLEKYNIEIAAGLGELKGKVWRVGLMRYSSCPENVILLLDALRRLLYDK